MSKRKLVKCEVYYDVKNNCLVFDCGNREVLIPLLYNDFQHWIIEKEGEVR